MDFIMASLSNGRRIKCQTNVDDFTKECLDIQLHWAYQANRSVGHLMP
ncbi:hypothetical protein ADIMK_2643 [Marinobacterium lacunae]|uniref:Mobile element protein n=1 Tax=Marinobacterium lacunae TaxID=1232683 RepID=A0A081FX64_9GAMM|nr:hypothetical protein ADIMK_2643 [Marinobacterium lacunae]